MSCLGRPYLEPLLGLGGMSCRPLAAGLGHGVYGARTHLGHRSSRRVHRAGDGLEAADAPTIANEDCKLWQLDSHRTVVCRLDIFIV